MRRTTLQFLLPSLFGVLIFLTPIPWDGQQTIGISLIQGRIKQLMGADGLHIVVGALVATSVFTLVGTLSKPAWIHRRAALKDLFDVSPSWLVLRLLGATFGLMYLFQIGPALLISEEIGGAVFVGIGVNVLSVYIAASLLMPLLTDFGLMEFAGTLARPVFRTLFRLPGRSAIDALTSFVGASSIGLLITIRQYDSGNYTTREACAVATNFSVVSIPFCLVVVSVAGIEQLFLPWYGFVVLACLLAAFITPRLPPLSRKADTYAAGRENHSHTESTTMPLLQEAWQGALVRAESAPGLKAFLVSGVSNMMFFMFSVMAAAMALATFAALVTFHTPLFTWLGTPFIGLLEFAQLPEASAAAPGLFSGYLDQYMPAIIASGIDSPATSFVLAGLSVCQLIFMSEAGVIMLRSSLPLSVADLALIFLLRTTIVLPVLIVGAHLVVG